MKKNKLLLKLVIATITTVGLYSGASIPASASELLYEFDVISDTHVGKDSTSTENTALALNCIKNEYSDNQCIVINGDVVEDNKKKSYEDLQKIIDHVNNCDEDPNYNPETISKDRKNLPYIYFNFGNHELRDKGSSSSNPKDYKTNLSRFATYTRSIQRDLSADYVTYTDRKPNQAYDIQYVYGNTPFIFLGTDYLEWDHNDCANLSDGQLNFLKRKIDNSNGDPIFVFCHQPIEDTVEGSDSKNCIRGNSNRLIDLLEDNPNVIMFTSHTHVSYNDRDDFDDGKSYATLDSSSASIFSTSSIINDEGNGVPQGCHVKVYDNKVVVRGVEYSSASDSDSICSKTIRY